MLLWESLCVPVTRTNELTDTKVAVTLKPQRLPYDTRCAATTKSGRPCRGKARPGGTWCVFHDPKLAAKRQEGLAAARGQRGARRLTHLPGGYLRKLTDRRSVGEAMDRLYREIRLGIITPEMGSVLFGVLTRMLDSGLADAKGAPRAAHRTRAARLRPKLSELLTPAERKAWRKAAANAPEPVVDGYREAVQGEPVTRGSRRAATRPAALGSAS